jgi:hypothetical protein
VQLGNEHYLALKNEQNVNFKLHNKKVGRRWVDDAVPPGGGGANTEQDVLIEGGKERQIYKCI